MDGGSNIARRRKLALAEGSAEYKAKREQLVQAAASLFKEKGYKGTTFNDIAERAGIERATIYYYFGGKDELFREAVKGILDANMSEAAYLLKLRTLNPRQRLERLLERLMISYEDNYPHMYVYIQERMAAVGSDTTPWALEMVRQTRSFQKSVTTLITQGVEQGLIRKDIDIGLAVKALFGMFNWTHRWFRPGGRISAKQVAQAFCTIFFDGMGTSTEQAGKQGARRTGGEAVATGTRG
jgi:TetR/AcrR family transcriptional regulator, cholesterol catabolism regulator